MTKKNFAILFTLCFLTGFIIGRFTTNKLSKEKSQSIAKDERKNEAVAKVNQQTQQHSTEAIKQRTVRVLYDGKGKIREKITTDTQKDGASNLVSTATSSTVTRNQEASVNNVTQTKSYESNWITGAYFKIDTQNIKNTSTILDEIEMPISYRVIGNVYVSAMPEINLKDFKKSSAWIGAQTTW